MSISERDAPQTNSTGLDEPLEGKIQRAWVWKSLVLLTAAVAVLAIINLARLDRLTGDQFTLIAVVNYEQDPSAFQNDGLFKDPSWYKAYLPWYRAFVVQLTRWTGDGAIAMWVMSVGLTAAMAMAFWLLFYWMKVDPMLATLGAVIGILPRAATGSELTGAGIIETALPRTFFSVGLPLAIFLILKSNARGRWCVAGFFLLGLLGNFHPQSAFFATAGLLLLLLAQRLLQWRAWAQVAVCGLAAAVGILPFGLTYPWEVTSTSLGRKPSRVDALQDLLIAGSNSQEELDAEINASEESETPLSADGSVEESSEAAAALHSKRARKTLVKRVYHALRLMNYKVTFPVFFLAVVPMALGVRMLRSDQEDKTSPLIYSARLCYLAAVLIGSLSIGCEFLNRILATWSLSIPFLDSVQPLRAARLVAPLCVAAFVLLLSKYKQLESLSLRRVQWAMLLMLAPVGVSLAGGEYVFQTRYRPVQEAAQWAKKNTRPGTLFLINPDSAIAFRVWAKRPVVLAEHDAVCVSTPARPRVRREIREIERTLRSKNLTRLIRLAQDYQASYVYAPDQPLDGLPSDSYQAGPFLSVEAPATTTRIATPMNEQTEKIR